jgi:excisionase family DNA binding protein
MTIASPHLPPLTLDQAAEYTNLSPRFLRREIQRGHLGSIRVGRMLRFTTVDLDEYLATNAVPRRN